LLREGTETSDFMVQAETGKWVGASVRRKDAAEALTGKATYTATSMANP
jgi:hypothetical protein